MDTGDDDLQHRRMRLGEAIRAHLDGRTQASLAGDLGIDQGYLSRILAGKVEGVTLDFVVRVEDALGLARGTILRAAGYVDGAVTLSAAAASDPDLTPAQRAALRGLIRSWRPEQP